MLIQIKFMVRSNGSKLYSELMECSSFMLVKILRLPPRSIPVNRLSLTHLAKLRFYIKCGRPNFTVFNEDISENTISSHTLQNR